MEEKSNQTGHVTQYIILTSPNCHDGLDFGDKAGVTETSWLDISVCLVVG